ncbi:hypothetical protein F4804DRAFT_130775 [Jackrogersella minutella]|nr:hypothetical protein F4804DRAFT_130775 [Jackrogersella minutella]
MPIIQPRRRLGLSVKEKPKRLLAEIKGRDNPSNAPDEYPTLKTNRAGKVREPKSITAQPQSSSDEDEGYPQQTQGSDDDDTESRRGDIKPTVFNRSPPSLSQASSNARRSARSTSKQLSQGTKVLSSSQLDEPSSSAGSKRSAEDLAPVSSSHLTNEYGFLGLKKKKTGTRRTATYGASSQNRSSQPKSTQKFAPKSSAPRSTAESPPRKGFKSYETSLSPENIQSPPPKQFIKPESISPEKPRSSQTFKMPTIADSSPSQDRPVFRHRSVSDESPAKGKIKLFDTDEESDAAVKPKSSGQPGRAGRLKKSKAKTRRSSPKPVKEELPPKPAFKLHALDDLDYLDESDDKVAAAIENKDWDDEVGDASIDGPVAAMAKCPMCHEVVDAELLEKFSNRGRMNIKKQTAFCRLHRRQTALNSRSQKGYPKINWQTLDTRLRTHQDFLKDVLEGSRQSYYRDVLKENVESGKNRTLLKTEDSLTPGYYGPRGLRAMTEYIMRTLSSVVRKRAVEDRLVSARGYTGYVQAVLVPELAVRLIMEDMDAAEEDARKIMQESIEVGELLYEDIGDVIAGMSDEEEE